MSTTRREFLHLAAAATTIAATTNLIAQSTPAPQPATPAAALVPPRFRWGQTNITENDVELTTSPGGGSTGSAPASRA